MKVPLEEQMVTFGEKHNSMLKRVMMPAGMHAPDGIGGAAHQRAGQRGSRLRSQQERADSMPLVSGHDPDDATARFHAAAIAADTALARVAEITRLSRPSNALWNAEEAFRCAYDAMSAAGEELPGPVTRRLRTQFAEMQSRFPTVEALQWHQTWKAFSEATISSLSVQIDGELLSDADAPDDIQTAALSVVQAIPSAVLWHVFSTYYGACHLRLTKHGIVLASTER